MARQRVAYDFEFFSLEQPSDAPVTVLSLGRSLLKDAVGVTLPLRPTAPLGERGALGCGAHSVVAGRAWRGACLPCLLPATRAAWLRTTRPRRGPAPCPPPPCSPRSRRRRGGGRGGGR